MTWVHQIFWLRHAKRSVMSWVVVIPKEGRVCMAAPALLYFWAHRCILQGGLIYIASCPLVRLSVTILKIHISESIIGRNMKLYHSNSTLSEKITSANGYGIIAVTGRAHCQRQVAFFGGKFFFNFFFFFFFSYQFHTKIRPRAPILLLVWQWLRTLGTFSCDATQFCISCFS